MILPLIAAISLSLVFLVETFAWFLRANALKDGRAYVISKSNIILYSSRGFAFGFQASISYYLETQGIASGVFFVCIVGFVTATLTHTLTFYNPVVRRVVWNCMVGLMKKINRWDSNLMANELASICRVRSPQLFIVTSISTAIFGLAITLPYLLALYNPTFRLTFTSLIQLLNFFGTIFLLYLVDPIMYKLMDKCELKFSIYDYIAGRIAGFLISLFVSFIAMSFLGSN